MFDPDIRHYRATPRSINDAFGPYAKLDLTKPKSKASPILWALGYGVAIGAFWYVILLVRTA